MCFCVNLGLIIRGMEHCYTKYTKKINEKWGWRKESVVRERKM